MNKYFFSYINDIPKELHNTLFCAQHLLAIVMVLCLWVILILIFRDKSSEKKWRFILFVSLLLPLSEAAQIAWYRSIGQFSFGYTLPLHLCSLMCVILPIMIFTKKELLKEYAYAMGFAPALMAILTPDVYSYPSFSFIYIQSMLVHGLICFIPLFLIFCLAFRPDIRKLPKVIGILIGLAILITPINYITDGNYFFLRYAAPGSPMELFEEWIGSPWYLIPTFLLGCVLWLVMYLPFVVIQKRTELRRGEQLVNEQENREEVKQHILQN